MCKYTTLNELVESCKVNPKGVNAWWVNCKRFNKVDEIQNIHSILETDDVTNIVEAVYEKINPRPLCICGGVVLFKSFSIGFSKYCSIKCARKDGTKTSDASKVAGARKRSKTLKNIHNDPVLGPVYKKKLSVASKAAATPKERTRRSNQMKKMIADGTLTPSITNTWTKWSVEYAGKRFRSSWEAIFYAYHDAVEYETLRIPYIFEHTAKTYIVDFVDHLNKIVYEIKPSTMIDDPLNVCKFNALNEWATNNGYIAKIIDEYDIKKMIDHVIDKTGDELFIKIRKIYKWD
jgi:hypothetical protein